MTSVEKYRWYLYHHHIGVILSIVYIASYAIGSRKYILGPRRLYFTYEDHIILLKIDGPSVRTQKRVFLSGFV
jgi:hypothetical protein